MKLIKKIGIGFLALIICVCSCFKFVNAFTPSHFDYTSENGNTLWQPLVPVTFARILNNGTSSTNLNLTQSFYGPSSITNQSTPLSITFDSELNPMYSIESISTSPLIFNYSRANAYNDKPISSEIEAYHILTRTSCFTLSSNYKYRFTTDYTKFYPGLLPHTSVEFDTDISYTGLITLDYHIEYFDNNELITYDYSTTTNDLSFDLIPNDFINQFNNVYSSSSNMCLSYVDATFDLVKSSDLTIFSFTNIDTFTEYINENNLSKMAQINSNAFQYNNIPSSTDIPTTDVTNWLVSSVSSFMNFEIFPNFSIGNILGVVVAIPLLLYILKLFMGG